MLVRFTMESGCIPVTKQAREDQLNEYLDILQKYDSNSERAIRRAIQQHLDTHTQFTAAWVACNGSTTERAQWHETFWPLHDALEQVSNDQQAVHEESGKFLGLLVWNEALRHRERWHFTKYPKLDTEYLVNNYFAMDGHICAKAKLSQAASARRHGDEQRAMDLKNAARALKAHWQNRDRS